MSIFKAELKNENHLTCCKLMYSFKPHMSVTIQYGGIISTSKVDHNAHLSSFPKATSPIRFPIPTRPSQIQSYQEKRNENESGAASCPTTRRLTVRIPLAFRAWVTRCTPEIHQALTDTQVDEIDWTRHVRTNT